MKIAGGRIAARHTGVRHKRLRFYAADRSNGIAGSCGRRSAKWTDVIDIWRKHSTRTYASNKSALSGSGFVRPQLQGRVAVRRLQDQSQEPGSGVT